MVDAKNGAPSGNGFIHVQDQAEMKLRMQELVNQTTGTKAQAQQLAQQGKESEKAVNDTRKLLQAGKYAEASAAAKAKATIREALEPYQTADGVVLPGACWLVRTGKD
jgi:hypothetical protein